MRVTQCTRLFEAEALRDGRLAGAERASFERHVAACAACAREVGALEALAEALRASSERDAGDELHTRRERTRLLSAFDGRLIAPRSPPTTQSRLLWSAAVAVLVATIFLFGRDRLAEQRAPSTQAVVHADATAAWSERSEGERETIVVTRGALWIHVDHSSKRRQLVVVLPDGELEDIGTTFTVTVEDGRTTSVAVEEGHVVMRLRGRSSLAIDPGETWLASAPLVPTLDAHVPLGTTDSIARSAPAERDASVLPPSATLRPAMAFDPSVDFRAAMNALRVGDNRRAATAFAGFVENHPRDPRAEDAAYLRVIALQKCGDIDATKRAALDYLRRYPKGFRRAEAESLCQAP